MQRLNDQEKAKLYNEMLFKYQRLQEEVRLIKSENFDLSESDQRRINNLENQMKKIYNDTKMLYM
jgi:hypothetical protein